MRPNRPFKSVSGCVFPLFRIYPLVLDKTTFIMFTQGLNKSQKKHKGMKNCVKRSHSNVNPIQFTID